MSMYAYKDVDRKIRVLAKETIGRNKGVRYYCPNPNCEAKMFLRSYDGERKSVFAASGNPGHMKHCPYGSENTYNPEKTKEEGFNSDDAISSLLVAVSSKKKGKPETKRTSEGVSEEIVPHTIKQIYDMCKAHHCKDTFNGQIVGQILLDNRSSYMYPKGVLGYRIIEAKCRAHLYDKSNIYLETPIYGKMYDLKLHFNDVELFKEVRGLLFTNSAHVIAIAGKWESSGEYNCFVTEFVSKRQFKVLKQIV